MRPDAGRKAVESKKNLTRAALPADPRFQRARPRARLRHVNRLAGHHGSTARQSTNVEEAPRVAPPGMPLSTISRRRLSRRRLRRRRADPRDRSGRSHEPSPTPRMAHAGASERCRSRRHRPPGRKAGSEDRLPPSGRGTRLPELDRADGGRTRPASPGSTRSPIRLCSTGSISRDSSPSTTPQAIRPSSPSGQLGRCRVQAHASHRGPGPAQPLRSAPRPRGPQPGDPGGRRQVVRAAHPGTSTMPIREMSGRSTRTSSISSRAATAWPPFGGVLSAGCSTGQTHYGDQYLCTRASRDQLTGVVFGLAFAMKCFEAERRSARGRRPELWSSIRRTLSRTAADIYRYLRAHDWTMVDPVTGPGGGVNVVSGLLRTAVELLYRRALMNQWTDPSWRDDSDPPLREELEWFREDMNGCLSAREIAAQPALDAGDLAVDVPRITLGTCGCSAWSRFSSWMTCTRRVVANPPEGWRAHSLTPDATHGAQSRAGFRSSTRHSGDRRGTVRIRGLRISFNRIRADVFMRHLTDPADFRRRHPDLDIYAVSRADFDRIATVTSMHEPRALRQGAVRLASRDRMRAAARALPPPVARHQAVALPYRSLGGDALGGSRELPDPPPAAVYPPHLMKFTTNFLFEKDPTVPPPIAEDRGGLVRAHVDRPARALLDDRPGRAVAKPVGFVPVLGVHSAGPVLGRGAEAAGARAPAAWSARAADGAELREHTTRVRHA